MVQSVPRAQAAPQGAVSTAEVASPADRRRFVELPYELYAPHSPWVPPLRRDERRRLSARHNAFLAHAEMRLWLAWREGRPVGRVAAIDDRLHNETHRERVTWFGFFEAVDDAVARALLAAVERHARARGSELVRGPANPSLNESAGLLVDAFADAPYVLMPYNPPSYPHFVEAAGYRKVRDLIAWDIEVGAALPERLTRLAARAVDRHQIRLRSVRMSRSGFLDDLQTLKHIYKTAWAPNWGFVPPTDAEVDQLARDLRPVLDADLVLFAEAAGDAGRPIGVAVAIPDLNQVLTTMRGRILPFGIFHFLRRRRLMTRLRVMLLGVLPDYQRTGVYPLLISALHRNARARGYTRAELSWTLEDNEAVNAGIVASGGRRHKTYRVYEKPVG